MQGPETDDPAEQTRLVREIAAAISAAVPPECRSWQATFALTVGADIVEITCLDGDARPVSVPPTEAMTVLARQHRAVSARVAGGPWWRLILWSSADGELDVDYDRGDEPFPDAHLFAPEAYRDDLAAYPRERLPIWLAAYLEHADRQTRSPQRAAAAVRGDLDAGVRPTPMTNELPDLPVMWARWAMLSAAFVAVRSERGPRVLPSLGWFESSRRAGSTLYVLPGGRAVLSGGVWNPPALDAVYNGGAEMPNSYAGAPDWVADPVLNPRAAAGLLSFCYWWDSGRWYRGESPSAEHSGAAIPGVWTADTVADIVASVLPDRASDRVRAAAAALESAAQVGAVTRELVGEIFDDPERFDIDGAMYQFSIAGSLDTETRRRMSGPEAIARVRAYITERRLDVTGYPLAQLRADRISAGWMVYVPVPRGEIAIGRAIFYIAEDGVIEHSSSSTPPVTYAAGFEQRYRRRQGERD
ncbi:hypothetical protein [Nocardia altamirensis]|uniref:hypothetical protein n=1 Tax=Nocardia altamirensis TaxID=472158 RepID=UPI0008407BCA|nr:hypothetical protein [Nocardia altamirensis]